jgi:hypothetical protein
MSFGHYAPLVRYRSTNAIVHFSGDRFGHTAQTIPGIGTREHILREIRENKAILLPQQAERLANYLALKRRVAQRGGRMRSVCGRTRLICVIASPASSR